MDSHGISVNQRLENSCQCSAWKTQKALPLGLILERLPIEWAQQGLIYTRYSLLVLLRFHFIY